MADTLLSLAERTFIKHGIQVIACPLLIINSKPTKTDQGSPDMWSR